MYPTLIRREARIGPRPGASHVIRPATQICTIHCARDLLTRLPRRSRPHACPAALRLRHARNRAYAGHPASSTLGWDWTALS
jgi:hypothetical protein